MKNQIFKSKEFGQIRTCMVNGETYFVGKDVASALGYNNPEKAVRQHVDNEDKGVNKWAPLAETNKPSSSTKAVSTRSSSPPNSKAPSDSNDG